MDEKYQPQTIEPRWQEYWEKNHTFTVGLDSQKEKYYLLEMFPYPSGRIHMGHVRNYAIGDVIARYKKMRGYHVIHPMGWDAFGMPAENAAIENQTHPARWIEENVATMKVQLKRMGFSYDWTREINTSKPSYYKWEQKFFLEMWAKDLVYRKESLVNWCPTCTTVLANEQVADGHCWRCDMEVVQKPLEQWFFRITNYTDELLKDLELLKGGWPERVLTMQKEWIGRSEGAMVDFPIDGTKQKMSIFTTRPDTLFGTTFMSIAPENPLVEQLIAGKEQEAAVRSFVKRVIAQKQSERADNEIVE